MKNEIGQKEILLELRKIIQESRGSKYIERIGKYMVMYLENEK
jgi:hypothetical protein